MFIETKKLLMKPMEIDVSKASKFEYMMATKLKEKNSGQIHIFNRPF